jgi:hypothetical protein
LSNIKLSFLRDLAPKTLYSVKLPANLVSRALTPLGAAQDKIIRRPRQNQNLNKGVAVTMAALKTA